MSKTEQQLTAAQQRKAEYLEKREKLNKEISRISATITSLEERVKREKLKDGIQKIEASGFSVDEILARMIAESQETEKRREEGE